MTEQRPEKALPILDKLNAGESLLVNQTGQNLYVLTLQRIDILRAIIFSIVA